MVKKVVVCLAVIVAAAFAVVALITGGNMDTKYADEKEYIKSDVYAQTNGDASEEKTVYTLKDSDGVIIIMHDDETIETDIKTDGLRAYDRDLLKEGIVVDDYEDVLKLIEDFNS